MTSASPYSLEAYLAGRPKECPAWLLPVSKPAFPNLPYWCARCGEEKTEVRGASCERCRKMAERESGGCCR